LPAKLASEPAESLNCAVSSKESLPPE
jgi:hypothetical protein